MRALALFLPCLLLAACDPGYGLTRQAYVAAMPNPEKVCAVIQRTPGVDTVGYNHHEGGLPNVKTDSFPYRGGSGVDGTLRFSFSPLTGRTKFTQSVIAIGLPPPPATVAATLAVMKRIEERLEREAGLTGLTRS